MKNLIRSLIASAAVMALTMTSAFAAGSISTVPASTTTGVVVSTTVATISAAVDTEIANLDKGTAIATVLANTTVDNSTDAKIANLALLTKVVDITSTNGTKTFTLTVPNLTTKDVYGLHYNKTAGKWEIVKPDSVNLTNKTITFTVSSLSPFAVVYDTAAATSSTTETGTSTTGTTGTTGNTADTTGTTTTTNTSTSVKTGDNTNMTLYVIAGLVAIAFATGLVLRAKKEN